MLACSLVRFGGVFPRWRSTFSQMSTAKRLIVAKEDMAAVLPPLDYDHHKGEHGRFAVVGGCKEYTGAPYFAAMTALRIGADLSHVFCTSDAATPIKCYSPDLIVHPWLDAPCFVKKVSEWLPRLHCIVIGPGLGRDESILKNVTGLIELLRESTIPVVIDGDGLFLVQNNPQLITGLKHVTLTPNVVEYKRLWTALRSDPPACDRDSLDDVVELSRLLGGVTVVKKGKMDIVSNGDYVTCVDNEGSPRRCGGQGDILAGAVGLLTHWAKSRPKSSHDIPASILGAHMACQFLRQLSHDVYNGKHQTSCGGRSVVTNDLVNLVGASFASQFEK